MIGIPVMPQDVPNPKATLPYAVRAVIENSTKPVFFSTDNCKANRACIELLRAAFPGDFHEQVYGISQLSSTSPLYWEHGVLEAIMDTVPTGVPLAILPEPIAGFTAPFTLAGLVTMNNAECLSGLVMIQLLRRGTKFLYANSWTTFDMRMARPWSARPKPRSAASPGRSWPSFYKLPCHTTAPNSDNHAHDEQNAWEKTFSQFCAVASGNDSDRQLRHVRHRHDVQPRTTLMDEEISASRGGSPPACSHRETIAADLIKRHRPAWRKLSDGRTHAALAAPTNTCSRDCRCAAIARPGRVKAPRTRTNLLASGSARWPPCRPSPCRRQPRPSWTRSLLRSDGARPAMSPRPPGEGQGEGRSSHVPSPAGRGPA